MKAQNLESRRLFLYPSRMELVEGVLDYYTRNESFLKEFEPLREESFYTLEEQHRLLAEDEDLENRLRFWIALKTDPSRLIGSVSLNNIIMGSFRSCFLGYKLDESALNRGYMTEAVKACTEYGFRVLGLHRIEANIMPRNYRSARVVEKLGFVNEGFSPRYLNINGVWEDHVHWVLLDEPHG